MEANPATLTDEKIGLLAAHGVNRLSLGAQSFQSHLLRFLERDHDARTIEQTIERARRSIPEVSLDLIFGVPGQTLEHWQADLRRAIDLGVSHVSTYGLTYEKGTRLWKMREAEQVTPLDEELERAMYAEAMDELSAAGFEQYEISNFAKPGHRCRHNETYWANEAYFGFGLGAARYVHGRRDTNTRDLTSYIQKALAGDLPVQISEELDPEERARETAMLQLRRMEGIGRGAFHRQTGFQLSELCAGALERHIMTGLLGEEADRVFLTREGKFLADLVCRDLWRKESAVRRTSDL